MASALQPNPMIQGALSAERLGVRKAYEPTLLERAQYNAWKADEYLNQADEFERATAHSQLAQTLLRLHEALSVELAVENKVS